MHPDTVKKMNEIIGMLKVIEREISIYGSMYEKKAVVRSRTPEIMKRYEELNKMLNEKGIDEETNKYYRELTSEISRVLHVTDIMNFTY